jgi:hypothetical protein
MIKRTDNAFKNTHQNNKTTTKMASMATDNWETVNPRKMKHCFSKDGCKNLKCTQAHPSGENRHGIACRNGDECSRKGCYYSHPSGENRHGIACRNGDKCSRKGCYYSHPSGEHREGLFNFQQIWKKKRDERKPDTKRRSGPNRKSLPREGIVRDLIKNDTSNGYHLMENMIRKFDAPRGEDKREYLVHFLLTVLAKIGNKTKFETTMTKLDEEKGWSSEERATYLQDYAWHKGKEKFDSIICHAAFAASKELLLSLIKYPCIDLERNNKWGESLEQCIAKSLDGSKNVERFKSDSTEKILVGEIQNAIEEIKALVAKNKAWEEEKTRVEEEKKNAPKKLSWSEAMKLKRKQRAEAETGELTA